MNWNSEARDLDVVQNEKDISDLLKNVASAIIMIGPCSWRTYLDVR